MIFGLSVGSDAIGVTEANIAGSDVWSPSVGFAAVSIVTGAAMGVTAGSVKAGAIITVGFDLLTVAADTALAGTRSCGARCFNAASSPTVLAACAAICRSDFCGEKCQAQELNRHVAMGNATIAMRFIAISPLFGDQILGVLQAQRICQISFGLAIGDEAAQPAGMLDRERLHAADLAVIREQDGPIGCEDHPTMEIGYIAMVIAENDATGNGAQNIADRSADQTAGIARTGADTIDTDESQIRVITLQHAGRIPTARHILIGLYFTTKQIDTIVVASPKPLRNPQTVGIDRQRPPVLQGFDQRPGRAAGIDNEACPIWNQLRSGTTDCLFLLAIDDEAVGDVRLVRRHDNGTAMGLAQQFLGGQLLQISSDGLAGRAKGAGQIGDRHRAFLVQPLENEILPRLG